MSDWPTKAEDHEEHHEGISIFAISTYLIILTIATSSTLLLQKAPGFWGPVTNMLFVMMVSVCKASLVVGFFMHFKFEKSWKYVLTIPPCVLGVALIFALMPDIAFESYPKVPWNSATVVAK